MPRIGVKEAVCINSFPISLALVVSSLFAVAYVPWLLKDRKTAKQAAKTFDNTPTV